MRCHPQADAGDRKAVDKESKFLLGIGYDFFWCIKSFRIRPCERPTPLSSSTTCGGPPHPLADGTAWGRLTEKLTDKPKFKHK